MRLGFSIGIGGQRGNGFNPAAIFGAADTGAVYDPADKTSLRTTLLGGGAVDLFGEVVGTVRDRSGKGLDASAPTNTQRPLYARVPVGGIRNNAGGAASVASSTYWFASSANSGITATKVGSGADQAGLQYVDYDVAGTASATSVVQLYAPANSRIPGVLGETHTVSFMAQILVSTLMPVGSGVRADVAGETAPTTPVETTSSTPSQSATETLVTVTRTMASGATNQVRAGVSCFATSGQVVNYRVRVKALQFEESATRTAHQANVSYSDISEAGKADRFALLFDQVDDAMATTLAAGTYTVAYGTDAGVTITAGVVHGGGSYTIPGPARLYGAVIINRALTTPETTALTAWLNARRP